MVTSLCGEHEILYQVGGSEELQQSICESSHPNSPKGRDYFCNPQKLLGLLKEKTGDEVNLEG